MPRPAQFPEQNPTAEVERRLAILERSLRPGGAIGSGTIADAVLTEVVAHGLGAAPSTVLVTPQKDERVWVTAVNATDFTVNRSGSTGALGFYWRVE